MSKIKVKSPLELEFQRAISETYPEIQSKIDQAFQLLQQAEEMARKRGIPFYSKISPVGQTFCPETFKKFARLDSNLVEELTSCFEPSHVLNGWEHSAICY